MENKLSHKAHHGQNIRRLRDILGIKQDTIAFALDMTQQNFSHLEQRPKIDSEILEKIAEIMKIPVETIENFSDDGVINIISSSLHNGSGSVIYNPAFNPLEKVIELYDKIIKSKDDEIAFLRNLLEKK